jgi:hypothetical protein
MLAENIKQGVSIGSIQSAIRRRIGVAGVQAPNQLRVFLDDDPQSEVGGWGHATLLKFKSAASQRRWQKDGQGLLHGPGVRFLRTSVPIWG